MTTARQHLAAALPMSEAQLQEAVIELAHTFGWSVAHFRPARTKDGSWVTPVAADGKGWPDLVLVRNRVLFRELKSERGKLDFYQHAWGSRLCNAGADWRVWRPADWRDGTIERALS